MRKSTLSRFNSDQGAGNYKKKFDKNPIERVRNYSEQKLIREKIAELSGVGTEDWALDMPCGVGRFYPVLNEYFPRVVQADWSGPMLQVARENLAPDAAGYVRLSATETPFCDKQFALVYSVRLCHHLPTPEERRAYIEEILRVSRGWVVLSFLDTFAPHTLYRSLWRRLKGKPLKWRISEEEVAAIAESQGFAVVDSWLLSRAFSGQRYIVLLRVSEAGAPAEPETAQAEAAKLETGGGAAIPSPEPSGIAARVARPGWWERVARVVSVWRGLTIGSLLAACLFLDAGSVEMDSVVLPAGVAIYALGAGLRAWARMHLHHRTATRQAFATSGPYRWVRNPLYLGNLGIIAGLAVYAETVYIAPLVIAISAALYGISARREEARLERLCGPAFRDYRNAVPAWIPFFPAGQPVPLSWKTAWLALRTESAILLALVPFVLVELYLS